MNRAILRIAVPNIVSNITVPLMGIFSTAIAGHLGDGDSAHQIGSLAIGVSIFNMIYWNCSFMRMGTSGLTAQAFGAGDFRETSNMLARAVLISLVMGVLMLVLQRPLGELSLWMMNGDALVADYFYARIWAVPAGIMLFGLNGWFTGMQNATIPMWTAITVNVLHVACSYWLAFGFDMGIVGIAYGSVVAQWTGMLLSVALLVIRFRDRLVRVRLREVLAVGPLREFFRVNTDIIVRTFCIVAVYTFFTAASARMGDGVLLAVNTMLLQMFTLFSYMNDGFAYAAEALVGRFIGARDVRSLRRCVGLCLVWAVATSLICIGAYVGWWREILGLFVSADSADAAAIMEAASRYIGWIIAIPLAAATPFLMDGIMVGATLTRIMRNSMLLATACYFGIFFALSPLVGNDALWLAFTLYMLLRGVLQYLMSRRLRTVYAKAER